MAGNVAPNIITNGLVLCLDAANTKSFVSGSTTWRDLTTNNSNGTLTNGPIFNSGNGGSIRFDGINDYVSTNTVFCNSNGGTTISYWIKCSSFPIVGVGGNICQDSNITSTCWNGTFDTLFYNVAKKQLVTPLLTNTVYHITIDTTNYLIYVNGVLANTQNVSYGWGTDPLPPQIGKNYYNSFAGNIYMFTVYNRILTAIEIFQNYNTTKGRFSL